MAHYLLYWKLKTVEYCFYGEPLSHVAHPHLIKAESGDVVWVVTVRGGDLLLAGRLEVGAVVEAAEAAEMVGEEIDAAWVALAATGTAEPLALLNLSDLSVTLSIRFESSSDRLRVNRHGRLNTLSLYHLRRLTDDTGALLNYTWHDAQSDPDAVEQVAIEEDQFLYLEGKPRVRKRVVRQRSSGLVNEAKARFAEEHGELRCEICGMSFADVYGEVGRGYIEAHHAEPISEVEGEQFSDVDGVVLVCANCHRMIHRRSPPYSIDELRGIVRAHDDNL